MNYRVASRLAISLVLAISADSYLLAVLPAEAGEPQKNSQATAEQPAKTSAAGSKMPALKPLSMQERQARFKNQMDSLSKTGVDARTVSAVTSTYQKLPKTRLSPNQATINFVRQEKRGAVKESSKPPDGFLAPVFRSVSPATYRLHDPVSYASSRVNMTVYSLQIVSADTASSILAWYKSQLEQSGWKLVEAQQTRQLGDYPQLLARAGLVASESITAQKGSLQCSVQITQRKQPAKTEVNVSVVQPQS